MNQQYRRLTKITQLKWAIFFLTNMILGISSFAQKSTGINNTSPSTKAALHVSTSTINKQGVIIPELLVGDTLSIAPTATDRGLFFYDYTNARFMYFDGAKWRAWKGNTIGTTPSIGLPDKVAFWNATGDFTSNNLFHWDNTNNRLGIGTASPVYPLHVEGDIYASPGILGSSPNKSSSHFSIQHSSLPLDDMSYGFLQSKSGYVSLNTPTSTDNNFIDFRVSDKPIVTFVERGDVGIGTATPGIEADKGKKYLTLLNNAGPSTLEMVSTSTDKSTAMTYMDFYNVLSGTPELIGRIRNAMVTNGSGTMSFFTADGGVMNQNLTINYDRSVTIGSLAGVGTALVQTNASGTLSRYTGSALAGTGVDSKVAFWNGTNTLTSNANFHWDNTNGRLGIGTVSPSNALHINAPSNVGDVSLRIQADADDNNENDNPYIEMYQDNLNTKAYMGLEAEAGTYATGTLKNALLLDGTSTSVGGVQLISNGNVGLTVNYLGNVGIGTNSPTEMLEVNGNVIIPLTGDYMYADAKQHVYAVGNMEFQPYYVNQLVPNWSFNSNDPEQLWRWPISNTLPQGSTVYATAAVHLPNGATVVSIDVTFGLGSVVQNIELRRRAYSGITNPTVIATATGPIGSGQSTLSGTASVLNAANVINNSTYYYYLRWTTATMSTISTTGACSLYGLKIRYSVTKAD